MDLPSTLNDALSELAAARADLQALNALGAEQQALVAQFEALKARSAELSAALDLANANNRDLAAALDAMKAAEADASAKANAIVANLGVQPVAIQSEQVFATKSVSELWAEYNSLPIQARNAFYAQHKAALKLS